MVIVGSIIALAVYVWYKHLQHLMKKDEKAPPPPIRAPTWGQFLPKIPKIQKIHTDEDEVGVWAAEAATEYMHCTPKHRVMEEIRFSSSSEGAQSPSGERDGNRGCLTYCG